MGLQMPPREEDHTIVVFTRWRRLALASYTMRHFLQYALSPCKCNHDELFFFGSSMSEKCTVIALICPSFFSFLSKSCTESVQNVHDHWISQIAIHDRTMNGAV